MARPSTLLLAFLLSAGACAQQPDFDPSKLKGPAGGPANEVLVLGSSHLSQLPKRFDPAGLRPLLDRLAAWRPQAIAIEALSGPQCDVLRRYPLRYQDTITTYCPDPDPARATTGLDVPAATAEAHRLLAAWPAAPTAAQRRRLAAVFLAGGEQASAVVQWLRLPEAERRAGDGLDGALVEQLNRLQGQRDESILVGAQLAARLGHERVYPMDDHTADGPSADEKAAGAAISKAWDNPATKKRLAASAALEQHLDTAEGVLAMYRAANAPGETKLAFDSDFGAALEEPSPQRFGRNYLGYWETRNLRMAANIREVLGDRPGMRMLVIVGASHKGYLEAYLHQMHDVRIVDTGPLLR
ncbi:DUF5694 domain-containing protein [Polyangium jinanense]|uniref:TraB/GumN family protein n=1 Tax=Polyangium jinanense TaxID=2829994 RepID=A0A9X3X823_9BACT|nr:DUF5694 domain-containing protein [Polyangium jinanense]MDC3955812.1 hypothetical protein [Polyangium jinanense]MDC3983171.1 hypothetical protein [Polyangium jinanense]